MLRDAKRHISGTSGRVLIVVLLAVAMLIGAGCERSPAPTGGGTPTGPTAAPPTSTPPTPTATPATALVQTKVPAAPATPTSTPASVSTPTNVPVALPEAVVELLDEAVVMATADLVGPGDADRAQLMDGILEAAVSEFLNAVGPGDTTALATLNAALTELPTLAWEETPGPDAVWVANLDDDDDLEAVAAFVRFGLQPYWYDRRDGTYRGYTLPADAPDGFGPWGSGVTRVEEVADLNGDGRADLLLSTQQRGASATIYYLDAFVWKGGQPANVLEWPVVNWAEPSSWESRAAGSGREFVMTCPAFGIYDAKLLPHPIQTRVYAWNGARFALAETALPEPVAVRDRFNRAEAAFERGDYESAATGYLAVTAGDLDSDDELGIDWVAFAYFRLGQIAALRDDPVASEYLSAAVARGGAVGELAATFGRALADGSVLDAFSTLQRSDVPARVFRGEAEGLDYIVDGTRLLAVGKALEWAMDRWDEGGRWSAVEDLMAAAVYELGPHSLADLDVDGRPEGLFAVSYRDREGAPAYELWLAVTRDAGYRALRLDTPVTAETVITARVIVEGHQVFVLETEGLRQGYVSWNGEELGAWWRLPTVEQIADPTLGGTLTECRAE